MKSIEEQIAARYEFLHSLRQAGHRAHTRPASPCSNLPITRSPVTTPECLSNVISLIPQQHIEHSSFLEAGAALASIQLRAKQTGEEIAFILTGQSGAGKSTLLDWYVERNPVIRLPDRDLTPVVKVSTPERANVNDLAEETLRALGDVAPHAGKKSAKTHRIRKALVDSGVELLVFDEFQQFIEHGPKTLLEVTNWLKNLIINTKVPIVIAGLPKCTEIAALNIQMRRRFSQQYYLKPFALTSGESFTEFRSILKAFHQKTPFPSIEFHRPDTAKRFLMASEGLLGYITKTINGACEIAQLEGAQIDLPILARAFKEFIWPTVPKQLNPFLIPNPEQLRSLRGKGELFEDWDRTPGMEESVWPQ